MSVSTCQLYLISPPALPANFATVLDEVLGAVAVAAFRLALPEQDEAALREAVAQIQPVTERHGVALILAGDAALARRLGCDGVHLEAPAQDVAAARRALGDALQLGVACGTSRDVAMQAGEDGADYIAFGTPHGNAEDTDVIEWWADLMELPVVAEGVAGPDVAAAFARAGADFVALDPAFWSAEAEPAAAARALSAALAAAVRA